MLTQAQLEARAGKLTSTAMSCLMVGDAVAIMNLWRKMTGDPTYLEPDLSDVWPVQLGISTETLNLDWFQKKHGAVVRRGEVARHPLIDWAAATLDGWCAPLDLPVETKHVGGREPLEKIVERYQPQMQWVMEVTGANQIALSVIFGANEPLVEMIPYAPDYVDEMKRRGEQFMDFVRRKIPPVALPPVESPVIPVRIVDMSENNQWSTNAITWLETRQNAEDNAAAAKILKGLVPSDAKKAIGRGISITRDRAGRLSLREGTK
jgi:YqaJ-like viral recombinase domain